MLVQRNGRTIFIWKIFRVEFDLNYLNESVFGVCVCVKNNVNKNLFGNFQLLVDKFNYNVDLWHGKSSALILQHF